MKSKIYDSLDAFARDEGFVSAMQRAEEYREVLTDILEVTGTKTAEELIERLAVIRLSEVVDKWITHNTAPYLASFDEETKEGGRKWVEKLNKEAEDIVVGDFPADEMTDEDLGGGYVVAEDGSLQRPTLGDIIKENR